MKRKRDNFIHQPVYPGGLKALRLFIQENLMYPKAALKAKVSGKVFIKYVVNGNGEVIETKVVHSLGFGCDEEAQRLVKLLKFNVKKTRGLKLKHNKSIRINFNLAQAQKTKQTITYTTVKKEKDQLDESAATGYRYEIRF